MVLADPGPREVEPGQVVVVGEETGVLDGGGDGGLGGGLDTRVSGGDVRLPWRKIIIEENWICEGTDNNLFCPISSHHFCPEPSAAASLPYKGLTLVLGCIQT